jgi:hypothetical protein
MAKMVGDETGLVDHAGADRTRIDLDQPDDVGIETLEE